MQIKLGEKIKALRKRDGRRQEDLAAALGITKQAVSRWEADGAYPDTELLPAIANYFHITIDELFGYDNDRETKLQMYISQADAMLASAPEDGASYNEAAAMLRSALEEFPSECRLQLRLAFALSACGRSEEERREAAALYQAVLAQDIDEYTRESALVSLITTYHELGDYENAKQAALAQPHAHVCREVLLACAAGEDERRRYLGEAALVMLNNLKYAIGNAVALNQELLRAQEALDILLALARLYESILCDGNCGALHSDLCMIYLSCTANAGKAGDTEGAARYFDIAFGHLIKYREYAEHYADHRYTAPLVSEVQHPQTRVVVLTKSIFEHAMNCLPEELAQSLRSDPKYSAAFA